MTKEHVNSSNEPNLKDILYPYTDRLKKNREFITRVWNLDNDERPGFVITPDLRIKGEPSGRPNNLYHKYTGTLRDRLLDSEKYLESQIYSNQAMMGNRGDFIPFLCPNIGVVAIPSAMGCEIQWWENDWPSAKPAITDPLQVYSLYKPKVTDAVMGMELNYTRHWLERTGGNYPIEMADCQSPLDIAAMILGHNNYLMALYTHAKEMHDLLSMITEIVIEFIQAQRDLIHQYQAEFVGMIDHPWIPDGFGVNIAHDENVMISPDMHDEFALPYLNQISEAFNGIFIHSCGRFVHNLRSFEKIYKLRGLEFGASEAPYQPVLDTFNGRILLAMRIGLNRGIQFNSMADFVRSVKQASKTNRGLFFNVNCDTSDVIVPENWPGTNVNEISDLIEG